MSSLLIGFRGFVGSNLLTCINPTSVAGKREIASFHGSTFDCIYCAAPQAKKWWANQNPVEDLSAIQSLISSCLQINCNEHFFLFSTVDVYDPPLLKTETDQPRLNCHPYGANRLLLESTLFSHFGSKLKIIRLPALVGSGLKKNIIFDLLSDNNVELIKASSVFQWFNLDYLPDIISLSKSIQDHYILNVVTEPILTHEIVQNWFPSALSRISWDASAPLYDLRTNYGPDGMPYLYTKQSVLDNHLKPFILSSLD